MLHEYSIQMLTYISEIHNLVGAFFLFFFLRTSLSSILNILFILLTSAKLCLYQRFL